MKIDTSARVMYLGAFLGLAINRVLARKPEALLPTSIVDDPDHPAWLWLQGFVIVAIIFAVYATWRLFRHAQLSQPASVINGLIAPLFWPLIMIPQAIFVFLRLRKAGAGPAAAAAAEEEQERGNAG